ncbi:type VII secretion integral membrane protein EccD, partial [Mycolicibacterium elephantis]|uniref:type VII secretion integral membrane protein EccD n=1 Tax=Mycolicibacterium elephantis TaxID=81858 RepID=UPI0007E95F8A
AAVAADRAHTGGTVASALSVTAVMFAATTGYLAVPAGQAAAHVLLSSAAALSMSTVLLRLTRCATVWLTTIATAAALTAAVMGAAAGWRLPPSTVGASLAAVSLAAMALAPRVSMLVTGIGPAPPGGDEPLIDEHRVSQAHQILTGMVVGTTAAATLGCAVVTFEALAGHPATLNSALFVAVMAVVLLLRTRTHVDPTRRSALGVGGIVLAAGCFAIAAAATPAHSHWLSLLAAAAGAAGLSRPIGLTAGPVLRRVVEVAEYVAVAAVVPLACWVAGVYGGVRAMGLA